MSMIPKPHAVESRQVIVGDFFSSPPRDDVEYEFERVTETEEEFSTPEAPTTNGYVRDVCNRFARFDNEAYIDHNLE